MAVYKGGQPETSVFIRHAIDSHEIEFFPSRWGRLWTKERPGEEGDTIIVRLMRTWGHKWVILITPLVSNKPFNFPFHESEIKFPNSAKLRKNISNFVFAGYREM